MKLILVYDGGCGLCSACVRWIRWIDWFATIVPMPFQSAALYRHVPALDPAACQQAMQVVLPGGRIRSGGDALRTVLAHLPLTAPLALVLAIPPLPALVRAIYPWIAVHRHAISKTCGLRR